MFKKILTLLLILALLSACKPVSQEEALTVIRDSFSKFLGPISYTFNLKSTLNQRQDQKSSILELNSQGTSDLQNPSKPQSTYTLQVASSGQNKFNAELEILKIAGNFYLKFISAPTLPDNLLNQWQKMPSNGLGQIIDPENLLSPDLYQGTFLQDLNKED